MALKGQSPNNYFRTTPFKSQLHTLILAWRAKGANEIRLEHSHWIKPLLLWSFATSWGSLLFLGRFGCFRLAFRLGLSGLGRRFCLPSRRLLSLSFSLRLLGDERPIKAKFEIKKTKTNFQPSQLQDASLALDSRASEEAALHGEVTR